MIKSSEKALTTSGINSILEQFHGKDGVGILSPARYDIVISPGTVMGGGHISGSSNNIQAMKRLSKSCEAAAFPGRSVSTQPNRIMGPVREMPYESLYSGDLDLTFRVGQDMFERKFFEFWMDTIVNHSTNKMSYYDDYTRDIFITQLGPDDSIVYKIKVMECYPKAINAIDLGFDKTDEYTRQSVSIAFREYEVISSNIVSDLAVTSFGDRTNASILAKNQRLDQEAAERRASVQQEMVGSLRADINKRLNQNQKASGLNTDFTQQFNSDLTF